MKITVIVEGDTEKAFIPYLRKYLQGRLAERMPQLVAHSCNGRVPTGDKLRRTVINLLENACCPSDFVIALTDVYTGTSPHDFVDAADAKNKMHQWVGVDDRFYPHAAQYDFEAWLLPYWNEIQKLAGHNKAAPSGDPESVDHDQPPASRIKEIFRIGNRGKAYVKPRDAGRILRMNDLTVAISRCPELRALVNTILVLSGGERVP